MTGVIDPEQPSPDRPKQRVAEEWVDINAEKFAEIAARPGARVETNARGTEFVYLGTHEIIGKVTTAIVPMCVAIMNNLNAPPT
ncbi:MAG: hypothetical protein ACREEN_08005, partial [Stellaceae bacterium]